MQTYSLLIYSSYLFTRLLVVTCFLCRYESAQKEVKDLEKGIAHLHNCMARYNALIADNASLKVQLVNDNFNLENQIGHELQVH